MVVRLRMGWTCEPSPVRVVSVRSLGRSFESFLLGAYQADVRTCTVFASANHTRAFVPTLTVVTASKT